MRQQDLLCIFYCLYIDLLVDASPSPFLASADVPTEDKSAFGAEMGDVAALLRSCGERSLVFVDEIGRGTSPKDGTSLAGAILEKMAESYMSGMFATHLHGILKLPYSSTAEARLRKKRMAISEYGNGQLKWTYTVEDGVCTNSLALLTAAKFGLPKSILQRAEQLSEYWGDVESEDDIEGHRAESGNMLPVRIISNMLLQSLKKPLGNVRAFRFPRHTSRRHRWKVPHVCMCYKSEKTKARRDITSARPTPFLSVFLSIARKEKTGPH